MSLYLVLEVAEEATSAQIKAAYRKLVRNCHPDVALVPNPKKFASVQQAYNVLGNVANRHEYDTWLSGFRGQAKFAKSAPQAPRQEAHSAPAQPATKMHQEAPQQKPEEKKAAPKANANGPRGTRLSDWFTGLAAGPTTIAWA